MALRNCPLRERPARSGPDHWPGRFPDGALEIGLGGALKRVHGAARRLYVGTFANMLTATTRADHALQA
jgi:hypothetical protein